MKEASEKTDKPTFSFGGPCPTIKPMFFPNDKSEKPVEIKEKDEQVDSTQSS